MGEQHEREERFNEEVGAEIAPARQELSTENDEEVFPDYGERKVNGEAREGSGLGMAALIMSILSLLFLPVLLGSAGIITGVIAYRRGSRGLGIWAIVLGALSVLGSFFISPYFR